jgi:hypothetical protein
MDDLSFTCPVPITRVYIEYEGYEQLTDPDAFSISSDGLTVTVFAKYLNQLKPDAFYTITADVTENIAQATFSIADCPLLVPGTALATGSEEPLRFTAPQDGYYTFSYENGSTNGELQILDPGTDSWQTNPSVLGRRFVKDETIYLRPVYDQAAEGLLSVLVQQVTAPAHGKIEFPAELMLLQDEACRGLMIDDVVFGDKIQTIGSKAFADCPNLRRVEIPVANVNIEDDAFAGSSNVILYAPTGGSVEQYAENYHIMFEAMLA